MPPRTAVEWHRSFSQSARANRKQLPTKTAKNEPAEWSISDFRRKYVPERSDELDSERYQFPGFRKEIDRTMYLAL